MHMDKKNLITKWSSKASQTKFIIIIFCFYIPFCYGLSQDTECSSLCCTVGPCCLSILFIKVDIC